MTSVHVRDGSGKTANPRRIVPRYSPSPKPFAQQATLRASRWFFFCVSDPLTFGLDKKGGGADQSALARLISTFPTRTTCHGVRLLCSRARGHVRRTGKGLDEGLGE